MSRSNPQDQNNPNPSTRWYEWNGEAGVVKFYDKADKKTINVVSDFQFILLDQLGGVSGWHELSKSGIYSNEVRDTRQDTLIVKAFKGGVLAEGLYKDIKDKVNSQGGAFTTNLYIAIKIDNELQIASLKFKGAALGAWMEFSKENRAHLYTMAIKIVGVTEGKKGRVIFRTPRFALAPVSVETDQIAVGLDAELQAWLSGYLKRNTRERVDTHVRDEDVTPTPPQQDEEHGAPFDADSIPF